MQGGQLPRQAGVWIYSRNVATPRQVEINKEILEKKPSFIRLVESYVGDIPAQCVASVESINWILIAFLLCVAPVLPLVVYFLLRMTYYALYNPIIPTYNATGYWNVDIDFLFVS